MTLSLEDYVVKYCIYYYSLGKRVKLYAKKTAIIFCIILNTRRNSRRALMNVYISDILLQTYMHMFSPIVSMQFHCFSVENPFHPKGIYIFIIILTDTYILQDSFVQFFYKFFASVLLSMMFSNVAVQRNVFYVTPDYDNVFPCLQYNISFCQIWWSF